MYTPIMKQFSLSSKFLMISGRREISLCGLIMLMMP